MMVISSMIHLKMIVKSKENKNQYNIEILGKKAVIQGTRYIHVHLYIQGTSRDKIFQN